MGIGLLAEAEKNDCGCGRFRAITVIYIVRLDSIIAEIKSRSTYKISMVIAGN